MLDGCELKTGRGRVRLKWHRAQRLASDAPFTLARIAEGLALGAMIEVDLRRYSQGGFVCLHDPTLDRETTGTGPIVEASRDALSPLLLRGADGSPTADPLLFLSDLAGRVAQAESKAQVQLDLKDRRPVVDDEAAERFGREVGPCADRFILSGHDWEAVKLLGAAAPGIQLGFDPCDRPEVPGLSARSDFAAFAAATLATAPEARTIYLEHRLLLRSLAAGCDLVALFHEAERSVDAWTMKIHQPNLARDLALLVEAGVDQITTGEPCDFEALWRATGSAAG